MDLTGKQGQSATELLRAHTHIWNYTLHYISSMSLKCAIELSIPDILRSHGQPMTLHCLLTALNIHPAKAHCIQRLMRILVHAGFFARQVIRRDDDDDAGREEKFYFLTPASQLLTKDEPLTVAPLVSIVLDPILTTPFNFLSAWFESDNDPTAFETAYGRGFWDCIANEPKFGNCFHNAMLADSQLLGTVVIEECKGVFEGLKSLVDVGAGTGKMARAIAKPFPGLKCTVLDLPHVVANQ